MMKRSFLPVILFSCIAAVCGTVSHAGDAVTSSDFANAWNGGSPSIPVLGEVVDGYYVIQLGDSLNAFSGPMLDLFGKNGNRGVNPDTNTLYLGPDPLAFATGWDSPLGAAIRNLAIVMGTNGAVSFTGNGTGAHTLTVDTSYFYGNTAAVGGAVNVQTQMQSNAANAYILTDNDFIANSAADGGAVAMATNNSIFTSGENTFSVIDAGGGKGVVSRLFGLNKATSGNGGGVYFMGNNALGVRNEFTARGYSYYQNSASGLGGAIFNGVLNGNGPSANNFTVTESNFIGNQAENGGAVATSINGGNTSVNVDLDSLFADNIATGNGGAVYNAVGDQYSPSGGAITFTVKGPFTGNRAANGGAIYNDLRPGQSTVIVNIDQDPAITQLADIIANTATATLFVNNTVSGNGGAVYNASGNNNPGTAVVNIADGMLFSGNSANYGGAIYNDGNGVINLNTKQDGAGIWFTDNSANGYANGADIYQASASAVINITGTGLGGDNREVVGMNGGIAGLGTLNQRENTILYLQEKSRSFDFKGTFNQDAGATLYAYGLMTGGANNIGGTANIVSGLNSVYFNANLLADSQMNYIAASTGRVSIGAAAGDSAPGIQFKGDNATVTFARDAGLNQPLALFTLESKLDNGQTNAVEFRNSDVDFGSTDFTGGTEYRFLNNSVINLAGPLDPYQQYTFSKLTTDTAPGPTGSLLSFRAGNDQGSLLTDTINVLTGATPGILDLGRVYVNDANGVLIGRSRVILGDYLNFQNGDTQYVTTSNGTYEVTAVDDQYIQFTSTNREAGNTEPPVVNGDGSTTSTTNHTSGGTTVTTTETNGGATINHTDSGGNTTTVTINPDGSATVTDQDGNTSDVPDGGSKTVSTGDGDLTVDFSDNGATTTTIVKTPDGGGGSSTSIVTTDAGGGGAAVENPNGSTATTTTTSGGASGSKTEPNTTLLALDDVNTLTGLAIPAGMTSATPRGFQIGKDETYRNAADLGAMGEGTFSVHGETPGTRTSTLSGISEVDGTTKQSLFTIAGADPIAFNLEDLTVEDAYSATGGSVLNMNNANSTATLINLTVQNNASGGDGGAVHVQDGAVAGTRVDYHGNTAAGNGGAVANDVNGNTTVRGGSFTENTAVDGGAIYNVSSHPGGDPRNNPGMTIASGAGVTFADNTATGDGGAIYNGGGGTLTLIADSSDSADPTAGNIIFSGNTADGRANDIHNDGDLIFTGSGGIITLGGGVSGTGTIRKEGESALIMGKDADNSRYTGTFDVTKGGVDANGKFFGGASTISGGILDWESGASKEDSARLQVTDGGTINVYGNLRLANPDDLIAPEAATNLYGNIDLAGGTVYLSTHDQVVNPDGGAGTVKQTDGYLIIAGADMVVPSGSIRQTGGVVRVENQANVALGGLTPDSGQSAGDIVITNATVSTSGQVFAYGRGDGTVVPTSGTLAMGDDALLNAADGVVHTHSFTGKFGVFSNPDGGGATPIANFSVDLDAQAFRSDTFVFNGGTATGGLLVNGHPNQAAVADVTAMPGSVVLSGLNLVTSPATETVQFTIMSATGGIDPGITFSSGMSQVDTPIGLYSLSSLGEGTYELNLLSFSPRAYRAQAATLAAVGGQSRVNSLLFDHVHLDSFDRAVDGRPLPRQFIKEGRGLWAKPYFFRENQSFGGGIGDADSDMYGVVLGMDFPAISMAGGWTFLPTVFAAYNGGRQDFADVVTTMDGGQAGFMGTFTRGQFAASVMGYAGGYQNEMRVAGYRDTPDNWFAGAAAKAAYTIRAGDSLLFQPYALASYNAFGRQSWHSDYGSIRMKADGFHGWNLAPGVAAAYNGDGWSVHASVHYMFTPGNTVTGGVGKLDLGGANTGGGYLEYGLGASRKIRDALSLEGKATFRSGSGTKSYGGHIGFSWEF